MSRMKFSRPSSAWLVLVCVSPRPVKPSIAKVETPIALNSRAHISMLAPMPPEPWISTTTGSRPSPARQPELARHDRRLGLGVAGEELLVGQRQRLDGVQFGPRRDVLSGGSAAQRRTWPDPAQMQQRHSFSIMAFLPGIFSRHNSANDRSRWRSKCPVTRPTSRMASSRPSSCRSIDDLSIDEASFRKHLRDVTSVEGLSAITINAHSTEVASCTFDEQKRVLDIAGSEDRRQDAAGQRHLGRRQRRGRPPRQDGDRRRRLRAAGVSAGAVHDGPERQRWRSSTSSASPTRPTCR